MRPTWAERIPPAVSVNVVRTAVPTGTDTIVLTENRNRFGVVLCGLDAGNIFYHFRVNGVDLTTGWGISLYNNIGITLTFCEVGRLVQYPMLALHAVGSTRNVDIITLELPSDVWNKIYSESITDMRPQSERK